MIIKLKVKPGSKVESIQKGVDGEFDVKIKASPVDGKANEYLLNFLTEQWNMPKSTLTLKSGHTSKIKYIEILDEKAISVFQQLNS